MKTNYISFSDAVKRFNNSLILCNNITEVDSEIWDYIRFSLEDEEGNYREIMQYFITDCSEEDVKYLEMWYGLLFTYSPALDCYILCVDHWGTSWSSVMIEDNSPKF
jgi:hypothetical protein